MAGSSGRKLVFVRSLSLSFSHSHAKSYTTPAISSLARVIYSTRRPPPASTRHGMRSLEALWRRPLGAFSWRPLTKYAQYHASNGPPIWTWCSTESSLTPLGTRALLWATSANGNPRDLDTVLRNLEYRRNEVAFGSPLTSQRSGYNQAAGQAPEAGADQTLTREKQRADENAALTHPLARKRKKTWKGRLGWSILRNGGGGGGVARARREPPGHTPVATLRHCLFVFLAQAPRPTDRSRWSAIN